MINTSMNISDASAAYLRKLLDTVPTNKRDVVWHQINNDILKIRQIWDNINKTNLAKKSKNETIVGK